MPRMLDLIRASAVPANLMQSAARGALSVSADEMIEILVYLATKNEVFGEKARLTLAGWDESSTRAMAANPQAPKEVLDYLVAAENFRPVLLPALLNNPSVSDAALTKLAATVSRDLVDRLLDHERVVHSQEILSALKGNPNLSGIQSSAVDEKLASPELKQAEQSAQSALADHEQTLAISMAPDNSSGTVGGSMPEGTSLVAAAERNLAAESNMEPDLNQAVDSYLAEHATEIAAQADKPFQPIGGIHEASTSKEEEKTTAAAAADSNPAHAPTKKSFLPPGEQRGSALQKISQLDIKGRIQLAMKGSKEERSILIRDGTKLVALAVLDSPKITDGEVEKIASQKNVLEAVLRAIPLKRRFMKQYAVVRNLVFNPRTPLDVSLGLMKNLLIQDLRNLSGNKEVSDTVRKLGAKMFKQKMDVTKKN